VDSAARAAPRRAADAYQAGSDAPYYLAVADYLGNRLFVLAEMTLPRHLVFCRLPLLMPSRRRGYHWLRTLPGGGWLCDNAYAG